MKPSNILFLSLCAGTLLVQFFLNLGYKKPYEDQLASGKNQAVVVNPFPSENIKVVLGQGVIFTIYGNQKQQGFKQGVNAVNFDFTMRGDTLVISSKNGDNRNTYFGVYFRQLPTLILRDANANAIAKNVDKWQVYLEKQSSLSVEASSIGDLNAVVSNNSQIEFQADATVNELALTLKDKSILNDAGALIKSLKAVFVSDSAQVNLSGKNLRSFVQ